MSDNVSSSGDENNNTIDGKNNPADHDAPASPRSEAVNQPGPEIWGLTKRVFPNIPQHTPRNDDHVPRGDPRAALRLPRQPKKPVPYMQAAIRAAAEGDDYADVQEQPAEPTQYIDTRPDGGFLNPGAASRGSKRKMKWTPENDRKLLLFGFGRNQSRSEFAAIAESFSEKPTAKAVEERYTKLRAQQIVALKKSGIFDAGAVQAPVPRSKPRSTPAPSITPSSSQKPSIKKQRVESTPTLSTPTAASQPRQQSSTKRQRVESTPALTTPTAASQPDQPSTKKQRAESTHILATPPAASLTPAAGSRPRQQPSTTQRRSRAAPGSMNNMFGQGGYHHVLSGTTQDMTPAFHQLQQRQFPQPPPNPFQGYSIMPGQGGVPANPYTYNLLPQAWHGPQQHGSPATAQSQQRDATGAEGGASVESNEDAKVVEDQTVVAERVQKDMAAIERDEAQREE